jgi:type IV secretory pathway TrbL component
MSPVTSTDVHLTALQAGPAPGVGVGAGVGVGVGVGAAAAEDAWVAAAEAVEADCPPGVSRSAITPQEASDAISDAAAAVRKARPAVPVRMIPMPPS